MSTSLSNSLLLAAQHIAGTQNYPQACLYLVPTPIGNLADISLRSLHVLNLVDAIACEDTRHTHMLLSQYEIEQKKMFALHQHNEQEATTHLLECLAKYQRVALVTDAGTPAISDPGARAVAAVQQAGYRVMPLPGASSITTALSAAGIHDADVLFHGFLSNKAQERQHTLTTLLNHSFAVVLLEAPHRIDILCAELAHLAPQRQVTLARELTKQFEQIVTRPAIELPLWLEEKSEHKKGEFVCIVHPAPVMQNMEITAYDTALQQALNYMPTKTATQLIASLTGLSKKSLYERALRLKEQTQNT